MNYYQLDDSQHVVVLCDECRVCGIADELQLLKTDVERWQGGEYVQTVFPWMTPAEREVLISGTHPQCWDALFGPEDDEYPEPHEGWGDDTHHDARRWAGGYWDENQEWVTIT